MTRARMGAALAALLVTSLAAMLLGVAFGSEPTSLLRALREPDGMDRLLLVEARLPRVLLAALAGGGLSMVGTSFQAMLRNPLAEPYVLGVSGGAAVGATAVLALGVTGGTALAAVVLPGAAFVGGLLATLAVYAIASFSGHRSGAVILLAGVIVNAFASALVTFVKTLVSASKSQELLLWLVGFLDAPSGAALASTAVIVLGGGVVLAFDAPKLNLLALGEAESMHLGVDVAALSRRLFFVASAVVGAIVCVTGLIGFVGLVVPHVLRRALGPDHRVLVPASFFGGAAALVLCDLGSRLLLRVLDTAPPVGAITAVVGGPLFLFQLVRQAKTP